MPARTAPTARNAAPGDALETAVEGGDDDGGFRRPVIAPDQWRAAVRRRDTSFSQGATWKTLISTYIATIPVSGDVSCPVEQSRSEPSPKAVTSPMKAKVGAAANDSQRAPPRVTALPLPPQALPRDVGRASAASNPQAEV